MIQRNQSLDVLRGIAILGMVLSSSIAFGILPAWMYHAQEPPPLHIYDPQHAGISWVDMVFPFFLFSMGAAIPLSLHKKTLGNNRNLLLVIGTAFRRLLLLTFFALFVFYARAGEMAVHPLWKGQLLSVFAFVLLCFQLCRTPENSRFTKYWPYLKVTAFLLAGVFLWLLPFKDGSHFSLYQCDIIILLLANMSCWGTLVWWFSRNNSWYRLCFLFLLLALILSSKTEGSWANSLFAWSPLPWMFQFDYLKYLFIIIPGTWAGDWMLRYTIGTAVTENKKVLFQLKLGAVLCVVLIITNISFLFARWVQVNLLVTVAEIAGIAFCFRKLDKQMYQWLFKFFSAAVYLLILGLFFEAFEGGVKKDPATFSYFFISSGLSFFFLILLNIAEISSVGKPLLNYLSLTGRNPMVAYVAGNLLLLPVLHLTGIMDVFNTMSNHIWSGVLRGFIFTGCVSLIAVLFTKRGWLWKT